MHKMYSRTLPSSGFHPISGAYNVRLSINREVVRVLTRQDLALVAAGENSLVVTEREQPRQPAGC